MTPARTSPRAARRGDLRGLGLLPRRLPRFLAVEVEVRTKRLWTDHLEHGVRLRRLVPHVVCTARWRVLGLPVWRCRLWARVSPGGESLRLPRRR